MASGSVDHCILFSYDSVKTQYLTTVLIVLAATQTCDFSLGTFFGFIAPVRPCGRIHSGSCFTFSPGSKMFIRKMTPVCSVLWWSLNNASTILMNPEGMSQYFHFTQDKKY